MKYNLERKDAMSWDAAFMAISMIIEKRSKDPSTQVGACIVGSDNRIISLGYNGTPNGYDDKEFPWGRD
ncbi:MAG TPA: cytidine deaminase, partial [Mollicutes bacterium]|nr:cytidine deaminase [Mollicutes bacterium]